MSVKQAFDMPTLDDDSHLSDHEWKLKMAAQGKAVYVPGKTVDEAKAAAAQRAAGLAQLVTVTLDVTESDLSALDTAIPDTIELLSYVGNILWMLAYSDDLDRPEVNSVMRLAAKAVRSPEDRDIAVIERFDRGVRNFKRERAQDQTANTHGKGK